MNMRMKFKKLLCFAMLISLILPNKLVYADDLANDSVVSFNQDAICDGWNYIQDDWYYFNSSKEPSTKWQFINGNWYYFNTDGKMICNQFVDGYYVNNSGAYVSDAWAKNSKGWWYRYGDGSYPANEIVTIGSSKYHFNKQGYMSVGWIYSDGWYYANKSGSLAVGWNNINGNWYYFSIDGLMLSGLQQIGGKTYLLDDSGKMLTGWSYVDGVWYYFNQYGHRIENTWSWIGDSCYYFYEDGHMASDENINGWYVDKSGAWIKPAWHKNSTGWWYRHGDGSYTAEGWEKIGENQFYFANDGYMQIGWIYNNSQWYYTNSNGYMINNCWNRIGDSCYYFYEDGHMASDENINGWYVDKSGVWIKPTWHKNSTGWWYRHGDGSYPENQWEKISGYWYYFGNNGYMYSSQWFKYGDDWYYFRPSGSMQTGWRQMSERYYDFGCNGKLCNGNNGQSNPPHIRSVGKYYIAPMLANKYNTRSERVEAMIKTGMQYVGTTYRPCWAGIPGTYCDCSGLVMQALYGAGYDPAPVSPERHALPAYEYESRNLWSDSRIRNVSASERQRGDLIFFHNGYGTVIHVGIYLGNNQVLEEWPPCGMIKPVNWLVRPWVKGYKRAF